ncbi:MAG: hypothetical protein ACLSWI_03445 [Candidatus Gastranaerophilaceae bacterium]
MIPAINASNIYSTLGSNSSLVPLAIKDVANSLGITAGSYITGKKTESEDRFIDEFGTQILWLGGIPFFKKLTDLTLYKLLKIDPKFDVRNFKDKEVLKVLVEKTPQNLKKSVETAIENPKFTKNLAMTKFVVSTALTVGAYLGLTKYRQHHRFEQALKEEKAKQQSALKNSAANNSETTQNQTFQQMKENLNKKQVNFTGGLQEFMINPVKNLMILDGVITEERLRNSESKQEFINYAIKEGSTWGFMYFAGPIFQKFFENRVMNKHQIPINFDSRIIESKDLDKALKNGELNKSISQFESLITKDTSDAEVYKFIHNNQDNFIVKMAKKADIIQVDKKSGAIDTRKYIDIKDFKDLKDRLQKLSKASENQEIDAFMKNVRKLKRNAIFKNMGICISALGIGVPLLMIASRYLIPNNKEYQVAEEAKKKLAEEQKNISKLV